ncbi:O-antigen ligase family protein [Rhodoferax sp.]|uniref:O-antigen ligase family protein n=1 Tax=Rhodoferax sp. TaxID=50421 RepID=UPI0025E32424|nr:O-antigen ligase family protein [Rhodoferax sp.]
MAPLSRLLANKGIYPSNGKNTQVSIPDLLTVACLALAPLCFLSVRSWTILFVFFLFLIAAWELAHTDRGFAVLQGQKAAQWTIAALASSFLAVLMGELLRGNMQVGLLDGPSRPLLAVLLFVYLLHKPIDFVRLLEWSAPISLVILCGLLWMHPYDFVNNPSERFGTVAVDPLTLGQYATLLGFICLFTLNMYGPDSLVLKALKILGILMAIWISVGTASRSGWAAIPVLVVIWVVCVQKIRKPQRIFWLLFGLALLGFAIGKLVPTVSDRIALVATEYIAYLHGGSHDTSTGLRISLLRAAGFLFLEQPLFGYGDTHYPALTSIPAIASFSTEALQFAVVHNGVHNEIMQSALRSGIFGLVSSILMFVVPAVVFYRGSTSTVPSIRAAGLIGLCYTAAVFCFGLSTETFNLKYTVSFYALMVSALAAQVLRPQPV